MLIKAFSSVFAIRKKKLACKERKAGMISHFQEIYPSFQYHNRICKRKHRDIVIELSVPCIETNKGNILPKEEKETEFWWILTKNFPKANDEEKSERWKMAEIFQEWLVGLWLFTVYFSYWPVIQADFSRQELRRNQLFWVVQLNRENWRDFAVSKL